MTLRTFSILAVLAGAFALAACGPGNNAGSSGNTNGNAAPADNQAAADDNSQPADNGGDQFNVDEARKAQIDKAWAYLKTMYNKPAPSQSEFALSGWGRESGSIPYTAIVLQGLAGSHVFNADDPMIKDSIEWLLSSQEPSGAWSYSKGKPGLRAVYITGIMAQLLSDLNQMDPWKGKLNDAIAKAVDYLKTSQVGHPEGPAPDYDENRVGFGGWAYSKEEIGEFVDKQGKPASNMSTTLFALDALKACGVKQDDPLWNDALRFLKRNHNAGEVQEEGFQAFAKVTDADGKTVEKKIKMAGKDSPDYGGAIYSEETSKVDGYQQNEDGTVTLHSYGSMTYNLLRGYLFAGLKKDSIPVKLAWGWIQRNYTVERVPGYRKAEQYEMGLYYYYMSMSKTLHALGVDVVDEPERGLEHDWRADLVKKLAEHQKDDGSWVNTANTRWQEDSAVLCTAFSLLALKHTRK